VTTRIEDLASAQRRGNAEVILYWIPLGAGDPTPLVRWSGRVYEALRARRERCRPRALYHSALEVHVGEERHVIETGPAWGHLDPGRGVAAQGPVGFPRWGSRRAFRYEVRRWRDGVVVNGPLAAEIRRLPTDAYRARRLLALVPELPTPTWGRDELGTGDMWNSNSVVSWLLAASGHDAEVPPPAGGRAPGWSAGRAVAARAVVGQRRI
jgi:hypothetical protein